MSNAKKRKLSNWLKTTIGIVAAVDFSLLLYYLMKGNNIALLDPKGFIAQEQFNLFMFTTALLFLIATPTLIILYFVAWRYRESSPKADYHANEKASKGEVFIMWALPSVFMLVLAFVMWPATHRLHPQQAIAHEKDPIVIQVVSLNWKWLFLYPEQGVASINHVQIPVDTPVRFELTADESPMSSFWIPNLSGQLYSMTTHVNRLHILADEIGTYNGGSAELNGHGFAGMKFAAEVSSEADFNKWVKEVKDSPQQLDMESYKALVKPTEYEPVSFYSSFEQNLFAKIVQKYYQPVEINIEASSAH